MDALFAKMAEMGASDLHLSVSMPPLVRADGRIKQLEAGQEPLTAEAMRSLFGWETMFAKRDVAQMTGTDVLIVMRTDGTVEKFPTGKIKPLEIDAGDSFLIETGGGGEGTRYIEARLRDVSAEEDPVTRAEAAYSVAQALGPEGRRQKPARDVADS